MRIVFIQRSAGEGGSKMSLLESLRAGRTQPDIHCLIVTWGHGRFVDECSQLGLQLSLPRCRIGENYFNAFRSGDE